MQLFRTNEAICVGNISIKLNLFSIIVLRNTEFVTQKWSTSIKFLKTKTFPSLFLHHREVKKFIQFHFMQPVLVADLPPQNPCQTVLDPIRRTNHIGSLYWAIRFIWPVLAAPARLLQNTQTLVSRLLESDERLVCFEVLPKCSPLGFRRGEEKANKQVYVDRIRGKYPPGNCICSRARNEVHEWKLERKLRVFIVFCMEITL